MTISSEAPQPNSLQYSTQFLNQTMFIDETTAVTSVTTCQSLEMSIVSSTNKRKTNDTVSMNEASVPLTKSVKIRKIHNRIPVLQKYSTIAQHVKMDNIDTNDDSASQQSVNLDVTRIYDANESINNDLSNDQVRYIITKSLFKPFQNHSMTQILKSSVKVSREQDLSISIRQFHIQTVTNSNYSSHINR